MIYFIWYAGWVSIIDSIVFVYLTLTHLHTRNRVTVKSEICRIEEGGSMKDGRREEDEIGRR